MRYFKSTCLAVLLSLGTIPQVNCQVELGSSAVDYVYRGNQNMGRPEEALADYEKAIAIDPACVRAYVARGNLRLAALDFNGSIIDFSKAIQLDPNSSKTYTYYFLRGNAKHEEGDLEGAIADFTQSISRQVDFGAAYHQRGVMRLETGDRSGGKSDLDKAEQVNRSQVQNIDRFHSALLAPEVNSSRYFFDRACEERLLGEQNLAYEDFTKSIKAGVALPAYSSRGNLSYDRHDFAAALADFRNVEQLLPPSPQPTGLQDYNQLRIWLSLARLGQMAEARKELETYLNARPIATHLDWPANLEAFLAGRMTETALLNAIRDTDSKITAMRCCEAYFYIGSVHLIARDKTTAEADFKKCLATNLRSYTEYMSAESELRYLANSANN